MIRLITEGNQVKIIQDESGEGPYRTDRHEWHVRPGEGFALLPSPESGASQSGAAMIPTETPALTQEKSDA
jgi:hypothetical protein